MKLRRAGVTSGLLWLSFLLGAAPARANPGYSVGAGHACNTCHIEPLGWKNPAIRDRRCTLDCRGCHLSPTGGGLRTTAGRYYGEQVLPAFGARPGDGVDPTVYLPPGYPKEGRYRLSEGFSGWWPGAKDHRAIRERYGRLNPEPKVEAGADIRLMGLAVQTLGDASLAAFPMEAQAYLAAHPAKRLTAYADVGVRGGPSGARRAAPWVRELFVMADDLPYNAYVRAGRFSPPYGWRVPDHTAFIRAGRFDQLRQVYGAEVGLAPGEGFANLALWRQGLPGWPGDLSPGGVGVTGQGGLRRLGYQLGLSFHAMRADAGEDELMAGPIFALNLHPFVYLGELDFRRLSTAGARTDSLATYHELRYERLRGLSPQLRFEALAADLSALREGLTQRVQLGAVWNPYRAIQLEADVRVTYGALRETAALLQVHIWIH
jgi:hypothetical protein